MNTEEQNKLIQQAIQRLPSYEAPQSIWAQVNEQLDLDRKEELIRTKVPQLQQYAAPEKVWTGIIRDLDQSGPQNPWIRLIRHPLSYAASFLLLFSIYWLVDQKQSWEVAYAYSSQPLDQLLLESDWDTDETAFAEVVELHQNYLSIFEDQSAATLQQEFRELNIARQELIQSMKAYGKDRELIRQLANIERARTQIVNQMAQQI